MAKRRSATRSPRRRASRPRTTRRRSTVKGGLLRDVGLWPLAPLRLAQTATALNAVSSVMLGRDMANGFKGKVSGGVADVHDGTARLDTLDYMAEAGKATGANIGTRLGAGISAIAHNARGTFSAEGMKRSVLPLAVTSAAMVGAKALKANRVIPSGLRKYVRVY